MNLSEINDAHCIPAMKNRLFTIEFNPANGTLKSLVLNDDPDRMNWVEGMAGWGLPAGFQFIGMAVEGRTARSHYRQETLELEVVRILGETALDEKYIYRNTGSYELYFQRGGLGVYATFNDNYEDSATCIRRRCHAHVWCGGAHSYVHARKMGPFPTDLALVLVQGSLDGYSVERVIDQSSNDRGDFVLHPSPVHLLPGEEMTLSWRLLAFPHDQLAGALLSVENGLRAEFAQETVFPDENFQIRVIANHWDGAIRVACNGKAVPWRREGRQLLVSCPPEKPGGHRFDFWIGERHFWICGHCSEHFEKLLESRIRFILEHQQMRDPRSPLHGAFMIYDNEEHDNYYSYNWRDHNTSGERGNMALLVCRWAQLHPEDTAARHAIDLYEKYLLREVYEVDTGIVHGDIGKHSCRVRLYNTAGLINFWLELYRLKKDATYLKWVARSIRLFYSDGGFHFYPNGTLFSDAICMIREAGLAGDADELTGLLRRHVAQIRLAGLNYPPHEVRFEQTIATPAVAIPAAFYANIDPDPGILRDLAPQIDLLERFSGDQPDHRLNEIPIRHWDEYWFGKRRLFGDTFPHYLACLTARAYWLYADITGIEAYREKAVKCLRNCLCLFAPDGTASCAYLYPFSVTMRNPDGTVNTPARRGEFFDPYANDQDGALYMILRLGGVKALGVDG